MLSKLASEVELNHAPPRGKADLLGYRSGYTNGHTSKYPSDTLNGYIGKYPADTKARAVVRYLASEPDRRKRGCP